MSTVDLDSLPDAIRSQIEALNTPEKSLLPLDPYRFSPGAVTTREAREMGQKLEETVAAVNLIWETLTLMKEKKK